MVTRVRYTAPGRPVVVTDAMLNWTAQQVFNFRFLKMIYTQFQQSPDCQLLAANSGSSNIGEDEFNTSTKPNLEPWHISWRNCDERAAAILRQHYGRPYFLPANEEEAKLEWIYLGSPGYRETMHIDVVEQPTWQAQLRGIKRWFLHPPPECYYQCESLEVTLQPGEIIVVDSTKWYHETTVISDEYSITVGAQFAIT
uniref:JmjC domain-containing protein n=1 Tax=Timema douglasi TaxID=61478 RepID=A0A7R8VE19_TIMDO|nr:unnamed protein product [Timema douglasi]